mmetsp:Transcript_30742/g.56316  ORF Transcript_30742/g.56316 Transcript_30742/m.56316 type:complete len:165 (+) Transcript_30742:94-588(+)
MSKSTEIATDMPSLISLLFDDLRFEDSNDASNTTISKDQFENRSRDMQRCDDDGISSKVLSQELVTTKKRQDPTKRRATDATECMWDEESLIDSQDLQAMKEDDPFLYYSNDRRRMEHLLGKDLPHMSSDEPKKRKTRLSFELDPFFSLVNSHPELLDMRGDRD